jgi:hypothetical protein
MFNWLKVDESYIQNIKVFTFGVNLPGGVLLRTSRISPLKHGESVGIAETFVPGVEILDGQLVSTGVKRTSTIEHPTKDPFRRFRGSVKMPDGTLNERGVSVLSKDWDWRGVLSQLAVDGWPISEGNVAVVGWPSHEFVVFDGEHTFVFELVGTGA